MKLAARVLVGTIILLLRPSSADAIEILAHYRLGAEGGVTYARGPDTIRGEGRSAPVLARSGAPRFIASAPLGRGGGALRFDGRFHFRMNILKFLRGYKLTGNGRLVGDNDDNKTGGGQIAQGFNTAG